MRKSLLSLAAVTVLGTAAFAQDVDSIWAANPDFATGVTVAERNIIELSGIQGLISPEGGWKKNHDMYTGLEMADGEMTVSFKRLDTGSDFYGDFTADWGKFTDADGVASTNNKFTAVNGAKDTLYGKVWNATLSDVVINAEYKLEVTDPTGAGISTASCRADVVDANARVGNATGHGTIEQNDLDATTEWTPIEWLFDDQVYDQYTGTWWEITPGTVTVADTTADFRAVMTYVPLNMTRITKLAFIIDHGATSTDKQPIGKEVVFTFKNFTVGDASGSLVSADEPVTASDLGIYPVPATDVVNVPGDAIITTLLGQVVATGTDAIDVTGLPAGVYTVTVDGGSANIIVE